MWFWVVAALLTLGSCFAILWPLMRPLKGASADGSRGGAYDIEVYRDQLSELERDSAGGLISPAEAGEARAEIARRILRADQKHAAEKPAAAGRAGRWVVTVAILAVPLVSWGLYSALGSPGLPGEPLAERLAKNPADSSVGELVARAEAYLAKNPSDARGWQVLAPIYVRMNRFGDAVSAYRNAIRLGGDSGKLEAGLGEAMAGAEGGVISAGAEAAFHKALQLEPSNETARFFLATAAAQDGRPEEAAENLRSMLAGLSPDSPWRGPVNEALAELSGNSASSSGSGNTAEPAPGPTAADMKAASGMSGANRLKMIEGMVASLDRKLKENPADPDGWRRLVRSYHVLGKEKEAEDAVRRGVAALGAGTGEAKDLQAFAVSLGLARTE
ncbi:MAG: c-type cytochrome biogenesis protein CcmI [Rhizobiaceae bacterium]|nr:MAG: c-type cytochrome biogenesis protein CcmI [Rhizobiaceae bacterium]